MKVKLLLLLAFSIVACSSENVESVFNKCGKLGGIGGEVPKGYFNKQKEGLKEKEKSVINAIIASGDPIQSYDNEKKITKVALKALLRAFSFKGNWEASFYNKLTVDKDLDNIYTQSNEKIACLASVLLLKGQTRAKSSIEKANGTWQWKYWLGYFLFIVVVFIVLYRRKSLIERFNQIFKQITHFAKQINERRGKPEADKGGKGDRDEISNREEEILCVIKEYDFGSNKKFRDAVLYSLSEEALLSKLKFLFESGNKGQKELLSIIIDTIFNEKEIELQDALLRGIMSADNNLEGISTTYMQDKERANSFITDEMRGEIKSLKDGLNKDKEQIEKNIRKEVDTKIDQIKSSINRLDEELSKLKQLKDSKNEVPKQTLKDKSTSHFSKKNMNVGGIKKRLVSSLNEQDYDKRRYSSSPSQGVFFEDFLKSNFKAKTTFYEIWINTEKEQGVFFLIEHDPGTLKTALNFRDTNIISAMDILGNDPVGNSPIIKNQDYGILTKDGDAWKITEKGKVEFK